MLGLSGWELLIVLLVLLLLFGSRLPSVMRSLGRSATEFKKGMSEITDENFREEPGPQKPKDSGEEKVSQEPPAG